MTILFKISRRISHSKQLAKASIAFAIGISTMATVSHAATFSVNGTDWDITTFPGSFENNEALLVSQVWYGNEALAQDFANAVGLSLGVLTANSNLGPLFAFDDPSGPLLSAASVRVSTLIAGSFGVVETSVSAEYAIATVVPPVSTVPLPAGGLLLVSGLAGIAGLRRRKKRIV